MAVALSATNLTKKFARSAGYQDLLPFRRRQWVTAVEQVSLEINEGELYGLLGPNGAGKTTLIKLLCCLVIPTSGRAQIFGHDILKEEREVRKLVGLVSAEERSFFWRLSGYENLQFFASLYRLPRLQAKKRIDEMLDLVGLADKRNIRFQNYSTGMRQKLAIARCFLSDPRILFVDEPTRSLDPISAQTIRTLLKEKVMCEKQTIILATHNLHEAEQLCDRLAILDHGKVIATGSVRDLRTRFQPYEACELEVKHLPDSVVSDLRLIDGVIECSLSSRSNGTSTLQLKIMDRIAVFPRIVHTVVQGGAEISNCNLKEPPLEEIFTRALRGTGEKG